jgi:hypothetical protein
MGGIQNYGSQSVLQIESASCAALLMLLLRTFGLCDYYICSPLIHIKNKHIYMHNEFDFCCVRETRYRCLETHG